MSQTASNKPRYQETEVKELSFLRLLEISYVFLNLPGMSPNRITP